MIDLDGLIAEARRQVGHIWDKSARERLIERLADALEAATRQRAAVPDAATELRAERDAALARIAELEPKYPEGWSTEDRQEAKQEAERRWSRPVSREAEQRYNAGNINGFILGAEWQKARETFISYKAIANEAEARIAEAAKLHRKEVRGSGWEVCAHCEVGMMQDPVDWPCPTAVALGLNEGEVAGDEGAD